MGMYWYFVIWFYEFEVFVDGWLKFVVGFIDCCFVDSCFQIFVYGDVKVVNFCFFDGGVVVVDFQYVGGGCGMKDVVYFFSSCFDEEESECWVFGFFDFYFE